MTKTDLIAHVASTHSTTKAEAGVIVETIFDHITATLVADNRFACAGFGTFTVRSRAARVGRNPKTGEPLKIKASKTVGFKPAPALKEAL